MKITFGCFAAVLATGVPLPAGSPALVAAATAVDAATQAPRPLSGRPVAVRTGALRGRMVGAGQRQALKGQTIKLCDKAGKQVCEITTAADGSYVTPAMTNGEYTLQFRDGTNLRIEVASDATISYLDIVLPQGPATAPLDPSKVPAAPGGAAPAALPAPITPGLGASSWAIIATSSAAVVAVPVAASNSSSGGENQVSASGLGLRR